jgi:RNA polymerase sigma-70 factor (ECF subfamily)
MAELGLKQVFMMMRPELLRFLAARGMNAADAEDLAQDLFLKLESLVDAPIAQPRPYLYQMANNLLLDRRKAELRRARRDEAWTEAQSGGAIDVDERPSAEQVLIARDRLRRITAVLGALPERTAEIFRRFRIDDVSQREIARDFGISLSAVEKHLQRAYRAVLDAQRQIDAESIDPRRPSDQKEGYVAQD